MLMGISVKIISQNLFNIWLINISFKLILIFAIAVKFFTNCYSVEMKILINNLKS
jgi:hypothetical protein